MGNQDVITESLFKSKLGMWFACQAGAKELLAALDAKGLMVCSKEWHDTICENAYDSGKRFGIVITQNKEGWR